ncbi:MAG: hypothetical protein AAGA65_26085 [Actinomycetota bacterium]
MSFGFGVATVVASIGASLIASVIAKSFEEQSSCISLWLLSLALRFQPESEHDEFLDEALGNLSRLEHKPLQAIMHAVGLVPSSIAIRRAWNREQATLVNSQATSGPSTEVYKYLAVVGSLTTGLIAVAVGLSGASNIIGLALFAGTVVYDFVLIGAILRRQRQNDGRSSTGTAG